MFRGQVEDVTEKESDEINDFYLHMTWLYTLKTLNISQKVLSNNTTKWLTRKSYAKISIILYINNDTKEKEIRMYCI